MATFPESKSKADLAKSVTEIALSLVPILGGPAAAILQQIPGPLMKRQVQWFNALSEKLEALGKTALTMEAIREGGPVLDCLLDAVQAAQRTSSEEKRQALVGCVVSAVEADSIRRAAIQMEIQRLEGMTEWHLRLLRLAHAPQEELFRLGRKYECYLMSSLIGLIEAAYPELRSDQDFVRRIWQDLFDMGLVSTEGLMTMMSASGAFGIHTAHMGKALIEDCFK